MREQRMEQPSERPPGEDSPGGPVYGALIAEALAEERARKDSLERRGVVMVTASAFLSALVLSLLTFTFKNISDLPNLETTAVWVSLGGFVLAAATGLAVNWPVGYSEPKVENLRKINEQTYWDNSQQAATHFVNQSRIMTVDSYRSINGFKGKLLAAALLFETVGIASLALLILTLIY